MDQPGIGVTFSFGRAGDFAAPKYIIGDDQPAGFYPVDHKIVIKGIILLAGIDKNQIKGTLKLGDDFQCVAKLSRS